MKGCVFDIRHYSVNDGPGIRTAVFFKGCPLRCRWCHNPESHEMLPVKVIAEKRIGDKLMKIPETIGKPMTAEEVVAEVMKSQVFFEESGGGVTLTGGEPLMQPEFLEECKYLMKQGNLHIALDTCGYSQPELFRNALSDVDLVLFDLKHTDTVIHKKFTGVSLEPILRNLRSEHLSEKSLIVRIPLVPGFNMSVEVYGQMTEILSQLTSLLQIDLLPYHYIASHKYKRLGMKYKMTGFEEPGEREVNEAVEYFKGEGFKVTIGG